MPQPKPQPATAAAHAAAAAVTRYQTIVAKPSHHWRDYRAKRLAMSLFLIIVGLWFAKDGFFTWPAQNQRIEELTKEHVAATKANDEAKRTQIDTELNKLTKHSDWDIRLQKILAFGLPPIGIFVLIWSYYHSRGFYRLSENVLSVPGHPRVPLDAIRSIDKTNWDRKGIVKINYELPNGATGSATLDDFIYEREPTDEIFRRIEDYTGTGEASDSQSPPAGA